MEIRVICASFVIVVICGIANGVPLSTANHHFSIEQNVPHKRNTRSPVVYVADEDDQRVVIITIKKQHFQSSQSGSNQYDAMQNQEQEYNLKPSQAGALSLIEVLRGLSIPGLPPPELPHSPIGVLSGGISGVASLGDAGTGPASTGEFGADLSGGILGGGFTRKKPTADMSNNNG